ncbi:MAG TPA: HAMP domain-containing sensor histidine kinase [Clostridia bacterium]|nr:HAMP domain-containing sensor histidine kinase [Clostridia bacterium]
MEEMEEAQKVILPIKDREIGDIPRLTPEGEDWFGPSGAAFHIAAAFGAISHEANNPLASIDGRFQLAKPELIESEEESIKDLVGVMERNIPRLEELFKKLSKVSLACNREGYQFAQKNIFKLVENIGLDFSEVVPRLEIDIQGEEGREAMVDRARFETALSRLFQNSLEAGSDEITVNIEEKSGEKKTVIEVVDNGAGFEKGVDESVFSLGASTKKTSRGTIRELSTGLFIAKTVVLACGGSISAANRSEASQKGAVIRIELPGV